MTPEAQRIAIARACPGLTFGIITGNEPEVWRWPNGKVTSDPLSDLNAMHEAWCCIPDQWKSKFERELHCIVLGEHTRHFVMHQEQRVTNATAAQRAEAFLRTLNLWQD